jgi:hypothetical protein
MLSWRRKPPEGAHDQSFTQPCNRTSDLRHRCRGSRDPSLYDEVDVVSRAGGILQPGAAHEYFVLAEHLRWDLCRLDESAVAAVRPLCETPRRSRCAAAGPSENRTIEFRLQVSSQCSEILCNPLGNSYPAGACRGKFLCPAGYSSLNKNLHDSLTHLESRGRLMPKSEPKPPSQSEPRGD